MYKNGKAAPAANTTSLCPVVMTSNTVVNTLYTDTVTQLLQLTELIWADGQAKTELWL